MNVPVYLFVCGHISGTRSPDLYHLLYMLPMVVARLSSSGAVIRYVLPVLRMTLYLHDTVAAKDATASSYTG